MTTLYNHTEDMGEISGFGGEYEATCQAMLNAAVNWSLQNPGVELAIGSHANAYGLVYFENEPAKELERQILQAAGEDHPTGAMMEAIASRAFFIHANGWDRYCEVLREHQAELRENPALEEEMVRQLSPAIDDDAVELIKGLMDVFGQENVVVLTSPDDVDAFFQHVENETKGRDNGPQ